MARVLKPTSLQLHNYNFCYKSTYVLPSLTANGSGYTTTYVCTYAPYAFSVVHVCTHRNKYVHVAVTVQVAHIVHGLVYLYTHNGELTMTSMYTLIYNLTMVHTYVRTYKYTHRYVCTKREPQSVLMLAGVQTSVACSPSPLCHCTHTYVDTYICMYVLTVQCKNT